MLQLRPAFLLASLLPSAALADPIEIPVDRVGPRWAGPNFHDKLGWYVTSAGDVDGDGRPDFAVTSPQNEGPTTSRSIVRIFFGRDGAPASSPYADWADRTWTDGDLLGDAVFQLAVLPDATGDGEADLLVAEPLHGAAGRVLLIPGPIADWQPDQNAVDATDSWVGFVQTDTPELAAETRPSLVGGGDFDGDGLTDVAIASGLYNRVWIDLAADGFGWETDLAGVPSFAFCQADHPSADFAAAITTGDWNGDGYADLAIGGPGCELNSGEVRIWYGGSGGLGESPDHVLSGTERLGGALHTLDLDADGLDDLVAQQQLLGTDDDPERANRGEVWIFRGSVAGLSGSPDATIEGGFADRRFGEAAALLDDVSNPPDGRPELVLGSPEASYDEVGRGAVYVFYGREWVGDLVSNDADWLVTGTDRDAWLGAGLAATGDWDGDGRDEVVIGEPNYTGDNTENEFRRGRIYVFNALPDRDEDGDGVSTIAGDCDDLDANVRPGNFEECDGFDNDCDHLTDEGCDPVGDDDDTTPLPGDDDSAVVDEEGCDCSAAPGQASTLGGLALLLLAIRRRSQRPRLMA